MTQQKAVVSSAENKSSHYPWIYFHGEAETLLGFDIVCLEKGDLVEGTQAVTIRDFNNNAHDGVAVLYYEKRHGGFERLRGLITLVTDTDSLQYALKKYNEKSFIL
jgi:hypothetical protein